MAFGKAALPKGAIPPSDGIQFDESMRRYLTLENILRLVFILYCVEAGLFLATTPWRDVWPLIADQLPYLPLSQLLLHPLSRSALTGFGLVHLIWGIHDLEDCLFRWRSRAFQVPAGESERQPLSDAREAPMGGK